MLSAETEGTELTFNCVRFGIARIFIARLYGDNFRQGQEVFSKNPVWFLGPPNISFELPETMSPRVRLPGPEADHSLPSSVDVKNEWR
jgi:hypothetical protein